MFIAEAKQKMDVNMIGFSTGFYQHKDTFDINFQLFPRSPICFRVKKVLGDIMKEMPTDSSSSNTRKQADVISVNEETALFDNGILDMDNFQKLRDTFLYLCVLKFALRGGNQHRWLQLNDIRKQLARFKIKDEKLRNLLYKNDSSKANAGHRSKAVKVDKRTSAEQLIEAYNILFELKPSVWKLHTMSVESTRNGTGLLNENDTKIECSYTQENVLKIDYVSFLVFNRSSISFEPIATFIPNLNSVFTPQGQYLKERVTLTNITTSSTKAVMIFNKLICVDATTYTCKVSNIASSCLPGKTTSNNISISVQAAVSTTQSSSTGSSSGADDKEEKSKGNLGISCYCICPNVLHISSNYWYYCRGCYRYRFLIVIIAWRRRKSKSRTFKNESKCFDYSKPKPVTKSRTGDYYYIALEDDATKTLSVNDGHEVEDIREHNKEYLKKKEEEEQKNNESYKYTNPTCCISSSERSSTVKKQAKTETPDSTDKQEEDTYAETQEGIYDKAGDRRHRENENVEHFDSSNNSSKQNSNGDTKLSIQTSQLGSYANQ
ncbi:unnamed protein product [Mytilus coruscus]|uniref:Uncharacterized protein n=1 Tax=Mytilus coruscus TaxID=42192 RepID=A0A6J8DE39_MYTCO|nr:unnamed protein product [Mytilus coruscus]